MISLTDEQAEELLSEIQELRYQHSLSDNYADYRCAFCEERPPTNGGLIQHRADCLGNKYSELLFGLLYKR